MSDDIKEIASFSKKTLVDSITKQVRYPRSLLFSLVLVSIFIMSAFLVKPDLILTFEDVEGEEIKGDDEDFAEKFGPITAFLLIGLVLPFIIWSYFREFIRYFLVKIFGRNQKDITDPEQQKLLAKKSRNFYFTMRKLLINIHSIGAITACITAVLHLIGLFPSHKGMSFLFSWVAVLSGIYLSSAGLLLRFRFKSHLQFTQRTSKIGRAIHLQLIIALIGGLAIIFHLSYN